MTNLFNQSDSVLFGINRAVIDLNSFYIVSDKAEIIENPKVIVDLLSPQELKRYVNLSEFSIVAEFETQQTIVQDKLVKIFGFEKRKLDLNLTPAGVVELIAECIANKSCDYLKNAVKYYDDIASNTFFVDQMCAIVSYYMNTPYDVVKTLPINEIYTRYAICQAAFPNQIQPISEQ
jgi:hypothetical protein